MNGMRCKNGRYLKSRFTIYAIVIGYCIVFGTGLKAQTATSLIVNDTRDGDMLPSNYKHVARFDFKYRSVIHGPGTGTYDGLLIVAPWSDASGGLAYQMDFNPSGLFFRTGNYTTNAWNAWSKLVLESSSGITSLGNGGANSGLNVNGTVKAREVNVTTTAWADDVFKDKYLLPNLPVLEKQIRNLGHLPDIPSEQEVKRDGVDLGVMNQKLLRKIEELTVYIINQDKRISELEKKVSQN